MKKLHYLIMLSVLLLACKKEKSSSLNNLIDPVSLNLQIQEMDMDISEDGFNSKSIDGPGGDAVASTDFYFYVVESGSSTFSDALVIEKGVGSSLSGLTYGQQYDVYATTSEYSDFNTLKSLSFPTQDAAGELYEGKLTSSALSSGENTATVNVALKTFYLSIDGETNKSALNSLENYRVIVTQNEKSITFTREGFDNNNWLPIYGLPGDGDIELCLYNYNVVPAEKIKTKVITSPQAGKKYSVVLSTSVDSAIETEVETGWDEDVTTIDF